MENEIAFIKARKDEKSPRKQIRELFYQKFDCEEGYFDDCWEEAHKVKEQPKEEKVEASCNNCLYKHHSKHSFPCIKCSRVTELIDRWKDDKT